MNPQQYCIKTVLVFSFLLISSSSLWGKEKRTAPLLLDDATRTTAVNVLRQAITQANEKEDHKFWPAIHAAEALTLAGHSEDIIKILTPLLKTEKNDQHRCGLARELVRAGDRSQAAMMLNILSGKNSHGHVHACESLYKVDEIGNGTEMRLAMQQTKNHTQAIMAAAALARWGNPHALKLLRKHLQGDDPKLRKTAAWVLARVGNTGDLPALKKGRQQTKDPVEQAYFTNAMANLGDDKSQQQLLKNLTSNNAAIRTSSATFASEAKLYSAKQQLIKLLTDSEVDVRVRAAQSLLVLSQPSTINSKADISTNVYSATLEHPRYSEGSILPLPNGSLLYATTEFIKGGNDASHAHIIAKTSADGGVTWSKQRLLQKNIGKENVMSVTLRYMAKPTSLKRPIGMFFLVKNSLSDLKVYLRISHDNAITFGKPILVTAQPGYNVMNNDRITRLSTGRWLAPVASSPNARKINHYISTCMISDDNGQHWRKGKGTVDYTKRGAMEPEVIELKNGNVLMIIRTQSGHIAAATSTDGGDTWGKPTSWNVRAPEAPATLRRIPSTGDLMLIWNDNFKKEAGHSGKRTPLTVAISPDEGKTWRFKKPLETNSNQGFAYTSLTFHHGRAVMSYYVREIKTKRISSRFRSLPIAWFYRDDVLTEKPETVLVLPPRKMNPRNSGGDFIRLKNGQLMFVYTHFYGGDSDHAKAHLAARFSNDHGKTWSDTETIIVQNEGGFNVMSVSLLRLQNDNIALFYLRKNSLTDCRPVLRVSSDEGKTWSKPTECISNNVAYFVMNNDRVIQLKNGRLIAPVALHRKPGDTKLNANGKIYCYLSDDSGKTWRCNKSMLTAISKPGKRLYVQEPGVVQLKDGRVMLFARSNSGSQMLAFSKDGGETFSKLVPSSIISPVSPASIERIPATGDLLMVWNNHSNIKPTLRGKRTPLTIAISKDDGKTWNKIKNLKDNPTGWYCYTAIQFVEQHILLGHCAGDRSKNNGLAETNITRLSLQWLYQ